MSCINQPPLYHPWMIWEIKLPGPEGKIVVVIGTISNVVHVQEVPKLKVCALLVSSCAQGHMLKARGKILAFNQLTLDSPKDCGTVLLSGPKTVERCAGISARPLESLKATSNPNYNPKARN